MVIGWGGVDGWGVVRAAIGSECQSSGWWGENWSEVVEGGLARRNTKIEQEQETCAHSWQ